MNFAAIRRCDSFVYGCDGPCTASNTTSPHACGITCCGCGIDTSQSSVVPSLSKGMSVNLMPKQLSDMPGNLGPMRYLQPCECNQCTGGPPSPEHEKDTQPLGCHMLDVCGDCSNENQVVLLPGRLWLQHLGHGKSQRFVVHKNGKRVMRLQKMEMLSR